MAHEGLVDKRAYLNTIGCLLQDSSLIDDIDRPLDRTDFNTENFYELLFVAIYNLRMQGCTTIDEFSIDSYLSNYKEQYSIFQENQGIEYLSNAREMATLENYEYYYHRLRKYSLLRYYEKQGLDTRFIYDSTIADTSKMESEQIKFDNYTEQDIIEMVEATFVINPNMKYCTNTLSTDVQAGDGMMDLVNELMEVPDVGLPLNNEGLNTVSRGARLGCLFMRSCPQGGGKAIPNDTLIPTPSGFRKVGDIKVGDYLFDKQGKPTKVANVFPQPEKKRVYVLKLADGRKAKCCEDHLWTYYGDYRRLRTESVKEILQRVNNGEYGFKDAEGRYRFALPINKAVQYEEKKYGVPPYVMGLLLGDGSFRYQDTQKVLNYSSEDDFLPRQIADIMQWDYKKCSDKNYSYLFKYKHEIYGHENIWVEEILKDYPELWNKKSEEKFIPDDYLIGSVDQRLSLLRGLLDTDGYVDDKARIQFTTTSPRLKESVCELCRSLGYITTVGVDKRTKYANGEAYKIRIQMPLEDKEKVFNLPKHLNKIKSYLRKNKGTVKYKDSVKIVSIKATEEYADMTCFTVDNPENLFLMNDYIVTHNTRMAAGDASKIAVPYFYDVNINQYVYTGNYEPTTIFSTEMPVDEIQTLLIAAVSKVNEEHILYGTYEKGELERVKQAISYIESSPLYIVHIPDFSIEDIKNQIKKYNREFSVRYFFFDYIHTSLRLMAEVNSKSGMGLKEHQLLLVFATELKTIAQQLDVFIYTASQLNGEAQNALYKDQNLLAGSKALANKLDMGVISMAPTKAEKKKIEAVLHKMVNMPIPNMCHWVYKVRRGRLTRIIIWTKIDLGTMTEQCLFVTNYDFELIDMDFTRIEQVEEKIKEYSVLLSQVPDNPTKEEEEEPINKKSWGNW
mgnify:CR=1 FL=1